jgi:hypothetical protein
VTYVACRYPIRDMAFGAFDMASYTVGRVVTDGTTTPATGDVAHSSSPKWTISYTVKRNTL